MRFREETASPEFRAWFAGASKHVRYPDGSPEVFYRGQRAGGGVLQSRLVMDSFTPSLETATMYASAQDGQFAEGSNIFAAYLCLKNPLVIDQHFVTFYELLSMIGYWDGKTKFADTVRILTYLADRHDAREFSSAPKKKRRLKKLYGFTYQIREPDEEEDEDGSLGLSYRTSLAEYRDIWVGTENKDQDVQIRLARSLAVSTYAFVETPAFKRALKRLGYDGVIYLDPFGSDGVSEFFGDVDILDLPGVETPERDDDWDYFDIEAATWTYRPLSRDQVWPVTRVREPLPNPRARRRSPEERMRFNPKKKQKYVVTVWRGVDKEAVEYAENHGHLPPSDPETAIPHDPDILESLYPHLYEEFQESDEDLGAALDEAVKEDIPWYNPKKPLECLKWSANVMMNAADCGYGEYLVELEVEADNLAYLDPYGMIKDIRKAKIVSVEEQ